MQQTTLDRWLRKKFAYITRFYCNVVPEDLPSGIGVEEAGAGAAASHRYRITAPSEEEAQVVVDHFRVQGITYNAQIEDRPGIASRLVNRPRRSLTYDAIWLLIIIGSIGLAFFLIFSPVAHQFVLTTIQSLLSES